ncbi:MAG: Coa1/Tim21 domain-containing protein [Planctomycetota bacterium]
MQIRTRTAVSSGRAATVILIVIGAVVVIAVGLYFLVGWGLDMVSEQVKADIQDNPVILEHIGRIESIEFDFMASGAASGDDTLVFNLKGTKGEGVLTAEVITVDDEHEEVRSGTLRLASGEKVDLFPEPDLPPSPR